MVEFARVSVCSCESPGQEGVMEECIGMRMGQGGRDGGREGRGN